MLSRDPTGEPQPPKKTGRKALAVGAGKKNNNAPVSKPTLRGKSSRSLNCSVVRNVYENVSRPRHPAVGPKRSPAGNGDNSAANVRAKSAWYKVRIDLSNPARLVAVSVENGRGPWSNGKDPNTWAPSPKTPVNLGKGVVGVHVRNERANSVSGARLNPGVRGPTASSGTRGANEPVEDNGVGSGTPKSTSSPNRVPYLSRVPGKNNSRVASSNKTVFPNVYCPGYGKDNSTISRGVYVRKVDVGAV